MKTHRIVLPRDQHAAALAGVDRLLLPLDHAAKARFSEADGLVIEAANYFTRRARARFGVVLEKARILEQRRAVLSALQAWRPAGAAGAVDEATPTDMLHLLLPRAGRGAGASTEAV